MLEHEGGFNMTWKELLYKKIEELEVDQKKIQKKLEKELVSNPIFNTGKKTDLMCEIQGIQMSINTLYQCIGKANEVIE
jgi:hypothetical protein